VESVEEGKGRIKQIWLERNQTRWAAFDLDSLIEETHPARTIWELSGSLDLKRFEEQQKTREGEAGRPCWPARLLISVWIYSYTLGVGSARAIERMLSYEPGLRWLCADEQVNHHTLSDFRVGHKEALQELFAQFLVLLNAAGLVDLQTLLQDGTKVRAVAGRGSYHRRDTLEKRLRQARGVVRRMEQRAEAEEEGAEQRHRAAQKRAAQEALERAEAALEKLKKLEGETAPGQRAELRVSDSEPEARKMKHADGGWGPSYNVQITTEAQSRMIVGIGVLFALSHRIVLLSCRP
jgi:transposase